MAGPSLQIPCRGHQRPPRCLGRRPAPTLPLTASPVDPPTPRPSAQQFHFPVPVGGARRAEHRCAHAESASAQVQLGRRPRSPPRLMERLPARGPRDRSPLSQAWAAVAHVVTHQGPDELQNGRILGEGRPGPPNQALGLGHPPRTTGQAQCVIRKANGSSEQAVKFMEISRSSGRATWPEVSPLTGLGLGHLRAL